MPPEEQELFRRLQNGDTEAVRLLFERYHSRVYRICLHYTGNAEDARDIAQETFVRAFRGIRQFRGDSALATWLTRIAMNLCLNLRRDQRTAANLLDQRVDHIRKNMPPVVPRGPEEQLNRREMAEKIRALINKLPRRERMAFVLKFYNDMKIREISEAMGISEGTVKSFLHRALVTMRKALAPEGSGVD
ncbi:MAG TPA: sigma-70 family RNA polymerase sigma factor [Candidatus Saccharimonadales bacterium]|nr:sigma-70 family RNA polymerase sigma factor [Candidatus Saccharimonadales bacterium]